MIEMKYSNGLRKAIELASTEAQRFNHDYVGTEHLLLGLIKTEPAAALTILRNLDVDPRKIRLEIERVLASGLETVTKDKLPLTPLAEQVVVLANIEARTLEHKYVGTEHLLLGLIKHKDGIASQILHQLGLTYDALLTETASLMGGAVAKQPAETPTTRIEFALRELLGANAQSMRTEAIELIGRMLAANKQLEDMLR
jgi:ATP-dependent Clp protease ATP-binding subunit ClpC